jgi:oligogalacturonide lyase
MDRNLVSNILGKSYKGPIDRREFLAGLAVLGGGVALASAATNPELLVPKNDIPENATTAPATTAPSRKDVGKVTSIKSEIKEYKDPKTGARVIQLTSNGSNNNHPYFTTESFMWDGADFPLFISDRSGLYQWYMLDMKRGNIIQLTAGAKLDTNMGCVARNGKFFYFDGPVLHYLNLETWEDRELNHVPPGFSPSNPDCSADGHYVTFSYHQIVPTSTARNVIYSTMQENYFQHPQSVVMRVDSAAALGAATALACWGEVQWISHSLIHPTQPNLVLFAHEGGHECVKQRMWMVDVDQKRARTATPLYRQQIGDSCVHEFFTRQGEIGFQYTIIHEDGTMEEFNAFVRADGTWIRQYRYPDRRPGHYQSNADNSVCVGDCAYFNPQDDDGNKYLALMTHGNGVVNQTRLAWHGTSWKTQESHPHPHFSPDDRWVIYNSDCDGKYNVYMVDTHSI